MHIEQALTTESTLVASILQEAAKWLDASGKGLWSSAEIGPERILRDTAAGLFFIAYAGDEAAGVMKFELQDAFFWPEDDGGTSAFVHKLAVRRCWAKKGVSTALLDFAYERARSLGRQRLRLDCVADRSDLRQLYERFGFRLHSTVSKGAVQFARYELPVAER